MQKTCKTRVKLAITALPGRQTASLPQSHPRHLLAQPRTCTKLLRMPWPQAHINSARAPASVLLPALFPEAGITHPSPRTPACGLPGTAHKALSCAPDPPTAQRKVLSRTFGLTASSAEVRLGGAGAKVGHGWRRKLVLRQVVRPLLLPRLLAAAKPAGEPALLLWRRWLGRHCAGVECQAAAAVSASTRWGMGAAGERGR